MGHRKVGAIPAAIDWLPARRSGAACDDVPPVTRMNAL